MLIKELLDKLSHKDQKHHHVHWLHVPCGTKESHLVVWHKNGENSAVCSKSGQRKGTNFKCSTCYIYIHPRTCLEQFYSKSKLSFYILLDGCYEISFPVIYKKSIFSFTHQKTFQLHFWSCYFIFSSCTTEFCILNSYLWVNIDIYKSLRRIKNQLSFSNKTSIKLYYLLFFHR